VEDERDLRVRIPETAKAYPDHGLDIIGLGSAELRRYRVESMAGARTRWFRERRSGSGCGE
jgi:hypothetical protein